MSNTSYSFVSLVLDLLLAATVLLAIGKGGRYERWVALLIVLLWLGRQAAQIFALTLAADLAVLAALAWLGWRHRPVWLLVVLGLQFVRVAAVTVSLRADAGPALDPLPLQVGCLALGVLARRLGPPAIPPAAPNAR